MTTRLAEYIWIDGTEPTALLRSKTKVLHGTDEPPVWGFDGSSTKQAEGTNSDRVLKPVVTCPDPFRGGPDILVLCEVLNTDGTAHVSNTRAYCRIVSEKWSDQEPWFGMEQEYTLLRNGKPLGFPAVGEPAPQGDYYCSAGSSRAFGREVAEFHLKACLTAGLDISGINAEVCPGQWEYQIGPRDPLTVGDQMWIARYIMERVTEYYKVDASWDGKPISGDWNGAGCHTNFSTKIMRESFEECMKAVKALGTNVQAHIENYGYGIKDRLTGDHETCSYKEFKFGVSDRTASIRIPWQVAKNEGGYIEDRRPNANCDPYKVTSLIVETVCSQM